MIAGIVPSIVIVESAQELERLGYPFTPLKSNSKAGFPGLPALSAKEIQHWARRRTINLGIKVGGGVGCLDLDAPSGYEFAEDNELMDSPMIAESLNGLHIYYQTLETRTRIKPLGLGLDFKCSGFMVCPPSVFEGFTYRWLKGPCRKEELPWFPTEILPKEVIEPIQPIQRIATDTWSDFARALTYANNPKVEGAVSGRNGHGRTIWFATRLLKLFPSITEDEMMACLWAFNERCKPPWDEVSLTRKCREAFRLRKG